MLTALRQRLVLSFKYLRDTQAMTFPTAAKAMQTLVTTGKRRNRVFVYDAYLSILNDQSRPLP